MRKRAALARAVIARPPVLIYDEPTAGLDPVTTSKIYDLLRAERDATGATVIAVSSDVDALRRFAPRMAMLHQGRLLYDGPTDRILDDGGDIVRQFVSGALEGPL
jgi:phospholipid/cholesterol/gamma-HCH transport system ATP-binding protein